MIEIAWRTEFDAAEATELGEMLDDAARQDAEAGFPALSLQQSAGPDTRHLLVLLESDDRAGRWEAPPTGRPPARPLAAYLRLEPHGDGRATASYVVRPAFRSRGVTTSLLERIGLDLGAEDGWVGTGVRSLRIWARGDHPAAQRLSRRFRGFGVRSSRREVRLLAALGPELDLDGWTGPLAARPPADDGEAAAAAGLWRRSGRGGDPPRHGEVLVAGEGTAVRGALWFDARVIERTEFGAAGRIDAVVVDPGGPGAAGAVRSSLLTGGMKILRDCGLAAAAIVVDAGDEGLLTACRLLRFLHDRSDTEYTIG